MKKSNFVIEDETLNTSISIFVNYGFAEFEKVYNEMRQPGEPDLEKSLDDANGFALQVKNKKGETCHVAVIRKFAWDTNGIEVLVHEISHCVFNILNYKRIPIRVENDEIFCYLLGFYYKKAALVLTKLSKSHGKRTKQNASPSLQNRKKGSRKASKR